MANDRYVFDDMCWFDAGSVSSSDIEQGDFFPMQPVCQNANLQIKCSGYLQCRS
jgi:hypothetical protein